MSAAKREFQPVSIAEMKSIVGVWVDAAMRLDTRDLRMMARLVRAQDKFSSALVEDNVEQLFAPQAVVNG
jgi:DSF synthase